MRTLKYAILGLINREPMTGYDITKEFNDRTLANFWYAKHSQIYPELNKLISESLVEYEIIIQGERMEKKLYSITDKGKSELTAWLVREEPLPVPPKDTFRLRLYFSEQMPEGGFKRQISSQVKKHVVKLSHLEDLLEKEYPDVPEFGSRDFGDYIVLENAIIREKSTIEWLMKCLSYIK